MTHPTPTAGPAADSIQVQIDQINLIQKQLEKQKMGKGQNLAVRHKKRLQQQALVELGQAKDNMTLAGTLAALALQIDFHTCTLHASALRGALLLILDKSGDPVSIAEFEQRDEQFQQLKRRTVQGVPGFIIAADPSSEFIAAARELKLRYNRLARGFSGTADVDLLVAMALEFQTSLRVTVGRELVTLVTDGTADFEAIDLVKAGAGAQTFKGSGLADGPVDRTSEFNTVRPQRPTLQSRSAAE